MDDSIDKFLKFLLKINEMYAPLQVRAYNLTYLSKISMLPSDDLAKLNTIFSICRGGISEILEAFEIPRIPSLHYKVLKKLINNVLEHS